MLPGRGSARACCGAGAFRGGAPTCQEISNTDQTEERKNNHILRSVRFDHGHCPVMKLAYKINVSSLYTEGALPS